MKSDIEKEVRDVLSSKPDQIAFEDAVDEIESPLNQAVKKKHGDIEEEADNWNIWKPGATPGAGAGDDRQVKDAVHTPKEDAYNFAKEPLDAPEQELGEDHPNTSKASATATEPVEAEEVFELPTATAKQAADTLLGMTNNVLAVGGGFFIKIRKHKEFYDFDEIVELIDTQNDKNVKRIKLDKEDKALLKPLLVAMLKKKAKHLTPEQQLIGAVISILVKKAQVVMEVRAENDILVDRILDIVREERGIEQDEDDQEMEEEEELTEMPEIDFVQMTKDTEAIQATISEQETTYDDEDLYENVVEIVEEPSNPKVHE